MSTLPSSKALLIYRALYEKIKALYDRFWDRIVPTEGSPQKSMNEIIEKIYLQVLGIPIQFCLFAFRFFINITEMGENIFLTSLKKKFEFEDIGDSMNTFIF